jgi:hypothetical protein
MLHSDRPYDLVIQPNWHIQTVLYWLLILPASTIMNKIAVGVSCTDLDPPDACHRTGTFLTGAQALRQSGVKHFNVYMHVVNIRGRYKHSVRHRLLTSSTWPNQYQGNAAIF